MAVGASVLSQQLRYTGSPVASSTRGQHAPSNRPAAAHRACWLQYAAVGGDTLGELDGLEDGDQLGEVDGDPLGLAEGIGVVGENEGENEGEVDGDVVGAGVGILHSISSYMRSEPTNWSFR